MKKIIILLGYMGCGKSTIGIVLADNLKMNHFDLDFLIEKKENQSVSEIFKSMGEIYFRRLESALFKSIIQKNEPMILSLGGGTPCYANNHELFGDENCVSIYLKANVTTLFERLINEQQNRPIIADIQQDKLQEYIGIHLFERQFYYNHARHIVAIDGKSTLEIVSEIEDLLLLQNVN